MSRVLQKARRRAESACEVARWVEDAEKLLGKLMSHHDAQHRNPHKPSGEFSWGMVDECRKLLGRL